MIFSEQGAYTSAVYEQVKPIAVELGIINSSDDKESFFDALGQLVHLNKTHIRTNKGVDSGYSYMNLITCFAMDKDCEKKLKTFCRKLQEQGLMD